MSEEQDLLSQISQLAGHINLHKSNTTLNTGHEYGKNSQATSVLDQHQTTPSSLLANTSTTTPSARSSTSQYGRSYRGFRHRNRSLVLKSGKQGTTTSTTSESESCKEETVAADRESSIRSQPQSSQLWVSRHDRHRQLINASIYGKDATTRTKAIAQSRIHKYADRDAKDRRKLASYLMSMSPDLEKTARSTDSYKLEVGGVKFQVTHGGSKLERIHDNPSHLHTPRSATVGGVRFVRSKNGNLYRAGLLKSGRQRRPRKTVSCKRFSLTGQCALGPRCAYIHEPENVAACRDYLRTGTCSRGSNCDLSHNLTYERVPACLHFLRGNCSKPDCRYAHVKANPSANICRTFTSFGFCSKGAQCDERHIFECPDYSNTGVCPKTDCHLPHVDRAGQLRNHSAALANGGKLEEVGADVSSDDDITMGHDGDDVDSEEAEDDLALVGGSPFTDEFSQDFIRLGGSGVA